MSKQTIKTLVPKLRFPEFWDAGEWNIKLFEDLYSFQVTNSFTRDDLNYDKGSVKNIHYGDIHTKFSTLFDISKEIVPYINSSLLIEKIKLECYCIEGDMVFADASEDLDDIGKSIELIYLNNEKLLSGMHTLLARQKEPKLKVGFGGYLFMSNGIRTQIQKEAQGTKVLGISATRLSNIEIYYPHNKEEQQKIADCLSSIDGLITAQNQKLDALKDHKRGLMQQLFPAEGEAIPKLRFPEFWEAEEWEETTLVQIAKFRRGSFPQPYGLPEWYDDANGMPFIQVFDVGDDLRLKPKTKSKISKLASEQSVFIPKGTVIITIQGSIGRVAITQYDAYIDRTLLLFEEFFKPIEKTFFAYVLQLLFEIEKQDAPGGIIKTITKEVLSEFKIKIPPIDEQEKIAGCFLSIDKLITEQSKKLDALKEHKKGLMQQLFPTINTMNYEQ